MIGEFGHMGVHEPVLVIAWNRPDHLSTLLERLREVKASQLFVAVDGPRDGHPKDYAAVTKCRELVDAIDWPCSVHSLFHEANLGCGQGVSAAITWFFSHVEQGIILEDDIIPDPSFFGFCSELLERFADDDRVFAVSGCNFVPPSAQSRPELPYRFSQVPHIWGWATWRRSWARHDLDISNWRDRLPFRRLWRAAGGSIPGAVYWASTFELLARQEVDTWDGQLVLASMESGQLTATSNTNLVQNIGFGPQATHTVEDFGDLPPVGSISLPLLSGPIELDSNADAWTRRNHFRATWRGMMEQAERFRKRRKRSAT